MIKVNNKKTISRIARTTYQANRKRNLLTILAIILTSFLLITVIGIGIQYTQALSRRNLMMSGRDYGAGSEVCHDYPGKRPIFQYGETVFQ